MAPHFHRLLVAQQGRAGLTENLIPSVTRLIPRINKSARTLTRACYELSAIMRPALTSMRQAKATK